MDLYILIYVWVWVSYSGQYVGSGWWYLTVQCVPAPAAPITPTSVIDLVSEIWTAWSRPSSTSSAIPADRQAKSAASQAQSCQPPASHCSWHPWTTMSIPVKTTFALEVPSCHFSLKISANQRLLVTYPDTSHIASPASHLIPPCST